MIEENRTIAMIDSELLNDLVKKEKELLKALKLIRKLKDRVVDNDLRLLEDDIYSAKNIVDEVSEDLESTAYKHQSKF